MLFAFNRYIPMGWLKCDGSTLDTNIYQQFYALIGNKYGGTAPGTFVVPDLTGAEPYPGMMYCICYYGLEPYVAQIQLFPYGYAPEGWQLCNGALLEIKYYPALFLLIDTTYGGDGKTCFTLPNLMDVIPFTNSDLNKPRMS